MKNGNDEFYEKYSDWKLWTLEPFILFWYSFELKFKLWTKQLDETVDLNDKLFKLIVIYSTLYSRQFFGYSSNHVYKSSDKIG